jgi:hypothetical protein
LLQISYILTRFGILYQEKSGNPEFLGAKIPAAASFEFAKENYFSDVAPECNWVFQRCSFVFWPG